MFGLKKFYVSYYQDAGMLMWCHHVIEAPDFEYAKIHWEELMANSGFAFSPIGDPPYQYEELFEVPAYLSDERILEIYG